MAKPASKSFSKMSRDEILDMDEGDITLGSKAAALLPPRRTSTTPDYWVIMTFFVAAAVRKGAVQLPKWLKRRDSRSVVLQDGRDYQIEHYFDNEAAHASTFTVYSTGEWTYDAGATYLEGKLQPPHSNQWIPKMLAKGTPGEVARQDLEKYKALRKTQP